MGETGSNFTSASCSLRDLPEQNSAMDVAVFKVHSSQLGKITSPTNTYNKNVSKHL